jgi:hypothetical protein
MAARTGTIIDERRSKPQEVEVDASNPEVQGARKALKSTGTVKVRDEEGRVVFYCLSVREYRRLKSAADPGE